MPKLWSSNQKIPWITNSMEEDFSAHLGDYILRVEQLDKGVWWWAVSYKRDQLITTLPDTTDSRERAIGIAEGVYSMHTIQNRPLSEIRFFKSSM